MEPYISSPSLLRRVYHPAMLDAAHLSLKFVILIIVLLVIGFGLVGLWCTCCCRRRRKRAKKHAQKWLSRNEPPKKERRLRLPGWMKRGGNSSAAGAGSGKLGEMELPRYSSSSSLEKLVEVQLEEVSVPEKTHRYWRK